MTRHLLELDDLLPEELDQVLSLAEKPRPDPVLKGRGVALVFEKPSARTRNSCEMAVVQLGGHPVAIRGDEVGLDSRERAEDVARTLGCYHAVIGARVLKHSTLERMVDGLRSSEDPVSVINLLSDIGHPCQALADLLTLRQTLGKLEGRAIAWVGDANNVCRSLALGAAMTRMKMRVAAPLGYQLDDETIARIGQLGGELHQTDQPREAVAGVDAIYTDVWTSMGQEVEAETRRKQFQGFTVDADLVAL